MQNRRIEEYLSLKRRRLEEIKAEISKHRAIVSIFQEKNWFMEIDKQIHIWEMNIEQ